MNFLYSCFSQSIFLWETKKSVKDVMVYMPINFTSKIFYLK